MTTLQLTELRTSDRLATSYMHSLTALSRLDYVCTVPASFETTVVESSEAVDSCLRCDIEWWLTDMFFCCSAGLLARGWLVDGGILLLPFSFGFCLLDAQNINVLVFATFAWYLCFWWGGQATDIPCINDKLPGWRLCSNVSSTWSRIHMKGRYSCRGPRVNLLPSKAYADIGPQTRQWLVSQFCCYLEGDCGSKSHDWCCICKS